ncbi:exodeoxyribonuclease VII large subunit [Porticoccus sp. W117]|uniref:exodeoxyribonuclease VII large subunit n=1 Tax=Porticoccus sp. W117 TaxID=3054777 RepID=UPI0025957E2E|nr:exodeoxyribonuclease VII large subunit [Porticoccus sp. W117]MDM3870136.1 exodeoxyribonuclease VII large subunit [Porticoccus sp. W117]
MTIDTTQRQVLSVSQLNRQTRQLLETHLPLIWVEGELSNFASPASSHWYFTLKDDAAQVRCAMFRNRNSRVRLPSGNRPGNGLQVMVRCRVSLYEGRGEFQLIVEHMEEAGLGALQRRFDQLKASLGAEGLFAAEHKQSLPSLPNRIGVVTSPSGAAIHDILQVLQRRFAAIPVTIYPTAVQGQEAVAGIVNAIEIANQQKSCDVLIVGRGGGSMEDLWAFNEEAVARTVFASDIPIVSAVGHEVDFTIADFVADLRAPTPSAAAELLSPDSGELSATINGYQQLLADKLKQLLSFHRHNLQHLQKRLRHPGEKLRQQSQHLDNLDMRLQSAMKENLQRAQRPLDKLNSRLARFHPQEKINALTQRCNNAAQNLQTALGHLLAQRQQRLGNAAQLLNAVSPLNTLGRGYSITFDSEGNVVKSVNDAKAGKKIVTRIQDGELHSTINLIQSNPTP